MYSHNNNSACSAFLQECENSILFTIARTGILKEENDAITRVLVRSIVSLDTLERGEKGALFKSWDGVINE